MQAPMSPGTNWRGATLAAATNARHFVLRASVQSFVGTTHVAATWHSAEAFIVQKSTVVSGLAPPPPPPQAVIRNGTARSPRSIVVNIRARRFMTGLVKVGGRVAVWPRVDGR